jgi:heme-degrading monooxygenase HmoA
MEFCAIYKMVLKEGSTESDELEFIDAWQKMTELIRDYEGGLGSRLHKSEKGEFIAYTQWPDKETWFTAGRKLPKEAEEVRNVMREKCSSIETIHELSVVSDLLVPVK